MGKIVAALVLGVAILGVLIWSMGGTTVDGVRPAASGEVAIPVEKELGGDLYEPKGLELFEAKARAAKGPGRAVDPVVIPGHISALEQQEVPSQVPGQILFVGDEIPEGVVQAAGVAAFMAEPCYYNNIYPGDQPKPKFYRRFYEGQVVSQDQMVAAVDYTKALGNLMEKKAKVKAAQAEDRAAEKASQEGNARFNRAKSLVINGGISQEEYGEKELTKYKLDEEWVAKQAAVSVAKTDQLQAEILLHQHEIRCKLPYNRSIIKTIQRRRGDAIKEGDTLMQLQNLDRLLAEAQLDSQYKDRLKPEMTATIEPSQEEAPARRLQGHRKDITCVAVSKDADKPLILSGSEDGQVLIWTRTGIGPRNALPHPGPIQSVACTPVGAEKNLCVVGLQDGSIYLWDLDGDGQKPLTVISRDAAHGDSVTSVAFSPDGKFFATGSADGSIKMWTTETGKELYAFDAAHGAESSHTGTVTSLTFLPQCRLVSAARDQTLRVWKLKEKGAVLQQAPITGRDNKVQQLGVSQDGHAMLFDQGRSLQFFSVADGRPLDTLQSPGGTTPFETLALFSPDGSLLLTAGAAEGRLQLWKAPTDAQRGFEMRQLVTQERWPVACAAFAPAAGQGGLNSFAVSASKHNLYIWPVPSKDDVNRHRIENVRLTLISQNLDSSTRQLRIGFEVSNPNGRLLPGRPVTIVID
jgi:WD40 repeat protein